MRKAARLALNQIAEARARLAEPTCSGRALSLRVRHQGLVTPAVRDAVTGEAVLAGPEIDDHEARRRYREAHPERVYAAAKRQLSRRELRRHRLANDR